jgi:hypothetical protein
MIDPVIGRNATPALWRGAVSIPVLYCLNGQATPTWNGWGAERCRRSVLREALLMISPQLMSAGTALLSAGGHPLHDTRGTSATPPIVQSGKP